MLFFDLVPWTKEAWAVPVNTIPLIHSRFIQSTAAPGSGSSYPTGTLSSHSSGHSGTNHIISSTPTGDGITFTLRLGTRHGIEIRVLKCETHRDLANWAHYMVEGVFNAVTAMRESSHGESIALLFSMPMLI